MNTSKQATAERSSAASATPHATKAQINDRLEQIRCWLADCLTRSEVLALITKHWQVRRRNAQLYVRKAEDRVLRQGTEQDQLVTLTFSQEMRGRILYELNQQLRAGRALPVKEFVPLVNAARTLLDARDRTARALGELRAEESKRPEFDKQEYRKLRKRVKLQREVMADRREPRRTSIADRPTPGPAEHPASGVCDPGRPTEPPASQRPARADCAEPNDPSGDSSSAGHPASDDRAAVCETVAHPASEGRSAPAAPGPRASPAEMRQMLDMMEQMEGFCRARGMAPPSGPPRPPNAGPRAGDPLERFLRDQDAQTLPAVAPLSPKARQSKEIRPADDEAWT